MKLFNAHAHRMSQFRTLIRSRENTLNIQTLILVVFIDTAMSMPELANDEVENIRCRNKTRKFLLFIMYDVFLKINTFLWIILILRTAIAAYFLKL